MIIYHGSDHIVEKPQYGLGKVNNDYGRGFYCTKDCDLAMEWAVDRDRDGYANMYSIDESDLSILDLSSKAYSVLHWITILMQNRGFYLDTPIAREAKDYLIDNFNVNYNNYDLIYGYRADDSYFTYAKDFINNTISLERLSEAMRYGNLGMQIVLKSEKAFQKIEFTKADSVGHEIWYPRKEKRDIQARNKYLNSDRTSFKKGETYILRIIEEELTYNDLFLR